jgi:hypothetical protein
MKTNARFIYEEEISSKWTEALFLVLTAIFFLLFVWRLSTGIQDGFAVAFLCFFGLFLFYSINFRTLNICITDEAIRLIFGIFTWTVPFENIAECRLDDNLPALMKYGGAGVHFMFIHKRYRVSFNFLEHSRVLIGLKKKAGLVRDVSFSTRQPDELIKLIQEASLAKTSAG